MHANLDAKRFTHRATGNGQAQSIFLTGGIPVTSTRDLDVAKDRLVDSLSVARDTTRAAVREDIAPAVAAAVGAAREASGPMYSEAASRASDAVSALRGSSSEAANAIRKSDVANKVLTSDLAKAVANNDKVNKAVDKALRRERRKGRKRWTVTAVLIAAGVAAGTLAKRRKQAPAGSFPGGSNYPPPTATDSTPQSAAMDLPVADPAAETPTTKKK